MSSRLPDHSALLLIDVINEMDFQGNDQLLHHALPAAQRIARLRKHLAGRGIPVIYVNDNFGQWRSDFRTQVQHCTSPTSPGREISRLLSPSSNDYFVLKPKHSGFYATPLDVLLEHLKVGTLILTGFAGDICVLYTANDAYMRGYRLIIPSDCVASESSESNQAALAHMKRLLKARVLASRTLTG